MKWPADVIASIALTEWTNKDRATIAVAVAMAATDGDDAFLFEPHGTNLAKLMGAWAVPWLPEMQSLGLNPYRLRDNAKLARIMTGPNGNEWDWNVAYRGRRHLVFMASAREAVANPRQGLSPVSPLPVNRLQGATEFLTNNMRTLPGLVDGAARMIRNSANMR